MHIITYPECFLIKCEEQYTSLQSILHCFLYSPEKEESVCSTVLVACSGTSEGTGKFLKLHIASLKFQKNQNLHLKQPLSSLTTLYIPTGTGYAQNQHF